jgi:hypothetical protein
LLAASATQGYTTGPGERSFTTALCDSLKELLVESKGETFSVIKLSERISTKRPHQSAVLWDLLGRYKRNVELGRLVQNPKIESSFQRERPEQASLLLRFSLGTNELSNAEIDRLGRQLPEAFKEAKIRLRRMEWVKMKHRKPHDVFRDAVKTIVRGNRCKSSSEEVQIRKTSRERKKRMNSETSALISGAPGMNLAQASLATCSSAVTRWAHQNPSNLPNTPESLPSTTISRHEERSDLLVDNDYSEVTSESDYDSSFECSEDSNSMHSEGGFRSTDIEPLKRMFLETLALSFVPTTRPSGKGDSRSNENSADNSRTKREGNRKHRATSPIIQDTDRARPSKRPRRRKNAHNNEDDDSDERSDKNDRISNNDEANSSSENDRRFACPFVKRFPGRYCKCYGYTLNNVARVKFRLSRDKTHLLPIYCPMCSMTFDDESLRDEHIRVATCLRRPPIQWEGITSYQRQQLKKRSPSTNTPEANWNDIFRLLFPNQPLPHSPYIDLSLSGELGLFREHMHTNGPGIWSSILDSRLPEELRPSSETLRAMSSRYFPEAVERLCQTWTSQRSSTDPLRPDLAYPTHDTLHPDSDGERFKGGLADDNEFLNFPFDDPHSNEIDRMMRDFSNPTLQTLGDEWTENIQQEWAEPLWGNGTLFYAPNLDLPDQPQAVFGDDGNLNTDNNPGASVDMGKLDDMLRPGQDESHNT